MRVAFFDLKVQYQGIKEEVEEAIQKVAEEQRFVLGPQVEALEETLARYIGVKEAIGVASGSDALLLALMALGIREGDEVITTPFTFFATVGAISRVGARPSFADIDPLTYNLDPNEVERRVTPKTRAIIPVHLFGQCADMDPIMEIAERRGLYVIEDAAQAIGAEYVTDNGARKAGSMGHFGCFSFYPTKNLGGWGDGGMVTTQDEGLAERVRMLRVHGSTDKYLHEAIGINSRLDALQAAVLLAKFPHLEEWNESRREKALRYQRLFEEMGYERFGITLPHVQHQNRHVFHQYVIRVPRRNELRHFLQQEGIGTEVYYPLPLHLQPCYRFLGYREGDFPQAERASKEVLALPIYPELSSEAHGYVVERIAAFFSS
ncbi:MAG: transcriptional regulator [Deltaproteobacteria bacterium]|nr:MAG: transcriptional regulator [Deltaproteobacteria bacterium]